MSAERSPKSSQNGSKSNMQAASRRSTSHTCCWPGPKLASFPPKLVTLILIAHLANCQQQQHYQQQQPLVQVIAARRLAETTTSLPASSNQISSPEPRTQPLASQAPKSASTTKSSWVERILIRVGNLHLENRRAAYLANRASPQAADQELRYDHELQHSSSSLSPTDSDEDDLIELTSSKHALSTLDTQDQPNLIESNELVQTERFGRLPTPSTQSEPIGCKQAYTNCAYREHWCGSALKAFTDDCAELIGDQTDQCSTRCLRSMIALRSSDEGHDLARCECDEDDDSDFCEHTKTRSRLCQDQVDLAINSNSTVSCSIATAICMADQACSTALDYYYANCQSLFSQRHCSPRCYNSLAVLYKQPKASKLINCQCDGTEEFACVKYKTYTERFCMRRSPEAAPVSSSGSAMVLQHGLLVLLILIQVYCYIDVK